MPTLTTVVVHAEVTGRSQYRYQFTPKHHGADAGAAQWLPRLTLEEEFEVFNMADVAEVADDRGRLYGVWPDGADGLHYLGKWNEQVAEFPFAREGEAWHGYPQYPLGDGAPENRQGEKHRPAKQVFVRMVAAGLITQRHRQRLQKGDHV
jgi:hypothetical protein